MPLPKCPDGDREVFSRSYLVCPHRTKIDEKDKLARCAQALFRILRCSSI